jgi:hypothetical protein
MTHVSLTKKGFTARRRPAFSLIAVLIIAMIAMGILGGVMFSLDSSYFTLRSEDESMNEYLVLQNEVEEARAFLKKAMMERSEVLRWRGADGSGVSISSLDDLLLYDPAPGAVVGRLKNGGEIAIGGLRGKVYVDIYDMQYEPKDLDAGISEAERAQLPPSLIITVEEKIESGEEEDKDDEPEDPSTPSDKTGSYLIKATFVNDSDGGQKTVEVALMQGTKD